MVVDPRYSGVSAVACWEGIGLRPGLVVTSFRGSIATRSTGEEGKAFGSLPGQAPCASSLVSGRVDGEREEYRGTIMGSLRPLGAA